MHIRITVLFLIVTTSVSYAQSSLTIPQIMQGQDFVGHWPSNPRWSSDSRTIYFSWNPDHNVISSTYKTDIQGNVPQRVSITEQKTLPGISGDYNSTRTKRVYEKNRDIFLMDLQNQTTEQLTHTGTRESNPQFNSTEDAIIFQMNNNLYKWGFQKNNLTQLTYFVTKLEKKKEVNLSDQEEWLKRDQMEYFDVLQFREERNEARKSRNDSLKIQEPFKIPQDGKTLSDLEISPDEGFVTYRLTKYPKGRQTQVPDFVTEEGYINNLNARVKVGSPQPKEETWIYDRDRDTTYQINYGQIPGIKDKPEFLKDYHEGDDKFVSEYEDSRQVYVHGPFFNDAGTENFIVIRSQDNKDRWIMSVDLTNGHLQSIDHQRDEAWIGGPGIGSWNFTSGNVGWINDETLFFHSEETGYSHIYTYNIESGTKTALTNGNYEIIEADLSHDKSKFFISCNKLGPEEHQFYHVDINTGQWTSITNMSGGHRVEISPDEKYLAVLYSYSNKPWELYVMENKPNATIKQVTQSTTDDFGAYSWRDPEIITFPAQDGALVKARLYKPESDVNNGAGVIFVHGAGYLQNVHKWWSSYYREYMFHNFLTDHGYTVLDIDYRASNGYGRDWRTGIYRWMGGKDLSDQVDGAKYMVEALGVDSDRIGIYGGSYGGFITLMGLFTSPKTFKCGAALRSVTDWAHYNHGYTSNILNTPVEDSIAFYKSSPIYHAENLEGHLLMLHGMIDRNVQFQDVVRLSQRLIELGKKNWELAVFPKEGHGFIEASSWTDEYRRIYELFEEHLRE